MGAVSFSFLSNQMFSFHSFCISLKINSIQFPFNDIYHQNSHGFPFILMQIRLANVLIFTLTRIFLAGIKKLNFLHTLRPKPFRLTVRTQLTILDSKTKLHSRQRNMILVLFECICMSIVVECVLIVCVYYVRRTGMPYAQK